MYTQYAANKLTDWFIRAQTQSPPAAIYIGLIVATRGLSSNIRSSAVTSGDTVLPATPNGLLYKCTTSGTTGASEPTWPTTAGGTVTDGTAVWTEQTTTMINGSFVEATYGSYVREALAPSLTNWAGTQAAGSTTVSTGTNGQMTTSNNVSIVFPSPTSGSGYIYGSFIADAVTGGNIWTYGALATPLAFSSGGAQPTFNTAAMALTLFN